MNVKFVVIATLLCTVGMFVFKSAFRMGVWPESSIAKLDETATAALKQHAPENGLYFTKDGVLIAANRTPGVENAEQAMGLPIGRQFVLDLIAAFCLVLLVGRLSGSAARRAGVMAVVGVGAGFLRDVPLWNWYGFSPLYTAFAVMEVVAACVICGFIAGALHVKMCGGQTAAAPG